MRISCKKCLLADMAAEQPLRKLMEEWLAAIPQEQKAAPDAYQERLGLCSQCDELMNGMCRLCGCYVELRAGKARMACPHRPPRWESLNLHELAKFPHNA